MADWKQDLNQFFTDAEKARATEETTDLGRFLRDVALPAFEELRAELEKHGRQVTVRQTESAATLMATKNGVEELTYRIEGRRFPSKVLPTVEVRFREPKGLKYISAQSMLRSGEPNYDMLDITRDEVIRHFIEHYTYRVKRA